MELSFELHLQGSSWVEVAVAHCGHKLSSQMLHMALEEVVVVASELQTMQPLGVEHGSFRCQLQMGRP